MTTFNFKYGLFISFFSVSFLCNAQTDSVTKIIFQGEMLTGFGNQVVSGDFNGDGIDDIIITSMKMYDPLIISLFYGSSNADTSADLTILADTVNDNFYGYSISNAGDINNDGFDDFIAGFYESINSTGRVLIYYGGNPMDAESDLIIQGDHQYCGFGNSVSSAGDINGDGFSDFMIQSSIDWYFQTDTIKVFLYFGSSNLDTIPDLIFCSPYPDDSFGSSISSVGDLNNDGYDDIIIGSKWNYNKVYVFFGSENPDTDVDLVLQNDDPYSRFGNSISGNIDLNLDGFKDIIISAHKYNIGNNYEQGRVYVYLGGNPMDSLPDLILDGQDSFGHFGFKVIGAGYFNEDVYPDFVIGSPGANLWGEIYIYFGGDVLNSIPDITLYGDIGNFYCYGTSMISCDFSSDGLNDILVGNYTEDLSLENNRFYYNQIYLYSYVLHPYKIQYEATNFIYEEPNSFTFDVFIKNNGLYQWQYRNGSLTFTFNRYILRNGNLSWSIVPGFSEFPEDQQPQNTIVYNPYTIGTVETIPIEGSTFDPGTQLRYARFRIQTSDSNFAIQPHNLSFVKTGSNKTSSSRWVWYDLNGRLFNNENISFIDLPYEMLPVELTSFTATLNQTKVNLNWQTATELNNQGFEVQRKLENSDWAMIDFVPGNGTTTEPISYSYEDEILEINSNKLYYRLKQIDFSGTFTYSDEVEAITQPLNFSISQNYPNPFNPNTKIEYQVPKASFVTIKVYNVLGKEVVTLINEEKQAGIHSINFKPKDLPSGLYFYKISAGKFEQTKKMLLLK